MYVRVCVCGVGWGVLSHCASSKDISLPGRVRSLPRFTVYRRFRQFCCIFFPVPFSLHRSGKKLVPRNLQQPQGWDLEGVPLLAKSTCSCSLKPLPKDRTFNVTCSLTLCCLPLSEHLTGQSSPRIQRERSLPQLVWSYCQGFALKSICKGPTTKLLAPKLNELGASFGFFPWCH